MPTFAGVNSNPTKMTYSSEEFERLWIRYKIEGMPHGISIQTYCSNNGVPYNLFDKWYRDTRHRIVPVQIDGAPSKEQPAEKAAAEKTEVSAGQPLRIMVDIRISNGLHIQQRGLSFQDLNRLVSNLEVLC